MNVLVLQYAQTLGIRFISGDPPMIVTTTPSIEGQHIESYLGPISAHVVFGVNMFSDIAASWRDVFGGRSQTYQKQLQRLTAAALIDLEQAAKKLKANAIVGLKMDYSELSSGGKGGMFMVVATGTAVSIKGELDAGKGNRNTSIIYDDQLALVIQKKAFFHDVEHNSNLFLSELLATAISLNAFEAFELFEPHWKNLNSTNLEPLQRFLQLCLESRGYNWTLSISLTHGRGAIRRSAAACLLESEDFRLCDLKPFLENTSTDLKALLYLATCNQKAYSQDDEPLIRELADLIRARFSETIRFEHQPSRFGKDKEVAICQCGGVFDTNYNYCPTCNNNKWGLPKGSTPPEVSINHLISIADALASISA